MARFWIQFSPFGWILHFVYPDLDLQFFSIMETTFIGLTEREDCDMKPKIFIQIKIFMGKVSDLYFSQSNSASFWIRVSSQCSFPCYTRIQAVCKIQKKITTSELFLKLLRLRKRSAGIFLMTKKSQLKDISFS